MKTQLTTLWKKRGLYRDTTGAPKERVQMLFPRKPQIENKNKTHKAQQQVPKTKKTKKLQHAILKPKSTLWKEVMVWTALAFASVWVFPHPGTLYRSHSPLLLEESFISGSTHSPSPRMAKVSQTSGLSESFSLQWFSPAPKFTSTQTCTTLLAKIQSPRLSTPCSLHLCLRTMWIKYIHEGKKIKYTFKFSFFLSPTSHDISYFPMWKDNEDEPQKTVTIP